MIITQNQAMKSLINDFIHNKNITNNQQTLIILLQGETGTGKEIFAREIHRKSGAKGKFVAVNCAAIPESLFWSHWFGHRKGSFSSAIEDRKGAFEEAEKGTLFLDEIGEIPLTHQAILLRALQEKKGYRTGEMDKERRYNIHRIICATNIELEKAVEAKTFREDLYHRIKALMIEIPPLKDRSDDISLLIDHFLKQNNQGTSSCKLMPDNLREIFSTYEWPGNVRQLQQELERLCLLSQDNDLDMLHCSPELKRHIALYYKPQPIDTSKIHLPNTLDTLVERLAKNTHDTWALKRHKEGWIYDDKHGDKTNSCLINYEFLPESEKAGNRNIVHEIMKAIFAYDYLIINKKGGLEQCSKQLEKLLIEKAITDNKGNITDAATDLEIDRATLSRKVNADADLKALANKVRKQ